MLDLRFSFVCSRRFDDLPGTDEEVRHCGECDLDVHNLDPLAPWQRVVLLKDAAQSGRKLCVSATPATINGTDCPSAERLRVLDAPYDEICTAGEAQIDEYDLPDLGPEGEVPGAELDLALEKLDGRD